jgi:hypothetical protein
MHTAVSYIEPLAGHLRHPWGWCKPGRELHYEFLIPAFLDDPPAKHGRHLLYDMGARTYSLGVGLAENGTNLPAQKYLVETYRAHDIKLDHMFMWDQAQVPGEELLAVVPEELYPRYQYLNIPVTASLDNTNAFEVLKKTSKPSDFVVVKLDIDQPQLEKDLLIQLANDTLLQTLIDEFYYEWNPFEGGWHEMAWFYQYLTNLRKVGIRAHGWI